MLEEIWKDIEGIHGYQVSNQGRVRSYWNNGHRLIEEPHIITGIKDKDGYLRVHLHLNRKSISKRVNILVANAFIPNPENKPQVNHKNGIKDDNNVINLEWNTLSENRQHAYDTGLQKPPRELPVKIIETDEEFKSISECARKINGSESQIRKCLKNPTRNCRGYHFKYVENYKKPFLYPFQMDAVNQMFNGCILNGGTGAGKSRTSLFYYFKEQGGWIDEKGYKTMRAKPKPKDLYIITTAKKRDSLEWQGELSHFLLSADENQTKRYGNKIVIDSWNNIQKYKEINNSFFIFDEDRVTGSGAWVKAFLKIAKVNEWIILSATPGDTYMDYVPIFIANGFFRNRSEFCREHVVYSRFTKYPKIDKYINTSKLNALRNKLLIDMNFKRHTVRHYENIYVKYDVDKYKEAIRKRWDPYKDEPIQQASGLCYVLRRIVNENESRQVALLQLYEKHPKMIVFYSFDYELDILLSLYYGNGVEIAQYNGHKHDPLPTGDKWVYLVNYSAGAEGWNAKTTDTIVFFSQSYSYKTTEQACGRIDRLNTPYTDLYYYHIKSRSGIDLAISQALNKKKNFNEGKFVKW